MTAARPLLLLIPGFALLTFQSESCVVLTSFTSSSSAAVV